MLSVWDDKNIFTYSLHRRTATVREHNIFLLMHKMIRMQFKNNNLTQRVSVPTLET